MKPGIVLPLIFLFFILCPKKNQAQVVNQQDSLALIDLFNNTEGARWYQNQNWLTSEPVNNWYGLTVTENRVTGLVLYNNNLNGSIPASLGNLTALTNLAIFGNNGLHGKIPTSIGNLVNLLSLNLSNNNLSDTITSTFGNLIHLTTLNLATNKLEGNLPSAFGNLTDLTDLALNTNQITAIPASLGNLVNLRNLLLFQNLLTSLPDELGNLISLKKLYLSENQLVSNIPASLGNLINLQELELLNNKLTGSIPLSLGNLINVTSFLLSDNQLTGSIPASLGNLVNAKTMWLFNNNLTGNIPASLGNLTNVTTLRLDRNQLSGTIPATLGLPQHLQVLSLYSNKLTGEIPTSLGNLSSLTTLALDSNQLTSSIPPELGSLSHMNFLSLSNNKLTGNIPSSLSSVTNLSVINLSFNQLSGSIPSSLVSPQIITILLSHNKLTGSLPALPPGQHGYMAPYRSFFIDYNAFNFDALEHLPKWDTVLYTPQATIPLLKKENKLYVSAGGTQANDTFRLYKNDILVETKAADSIFTITSSGKYHITVTNSLAKKITLLSDTLNISTLVTTVSSFIGKVTHNDAMLTWASLTDNSADLFIVQRSLDGISFNDIATLSTANNSGLLKQYSYNDINISLLNTNILYYRLKVIDRTGQSFLSNVLALKVDARFVINSYPNPANNILTLTFHGLNKNKCDIKIIDLAGKTIKQISNSGIVITSLKINIQSLAKGTYYIVINDNENFFTQKFIKE